MSDQPVGYDREWTARSGRRTRRRVGYSHDQGRVTRFVVQLEYKLGDEWETVVRYDHDEYGDQRHDVSDEGLHIDIYRHGEKHATEFITRPVPAGVGLNLAEDHLSENAQRFIRRFEEWHAE